MIEQNGTFTGEGGNPYGRSGTRSTVKLDGAVSVLEWSGYPEDECDSESQSDCI
jgi:hypothetical protein